jgi:hypothetical protein
LTGSAALQGLRVAIDVQHLYRVGLFRNDRGTRFRLADGATIYEAEAATLYAQALAGYLAARGAAVLVNNPALDKLTGYYSSRNREATLWGAHLYLACHVNAGGGTYSRIEYMRDLPASTGVAASAAAEWINGGLSYLPELRSGSTALLRHGERGAVCIERCGQWVAALLLEPFFGDSARHRRLLSASGLKTVGDLIGQGVASWWRATSAPT